MVPRLRHISDSENIGITDDALRLIAFLATGAMRDALSMLELFVGQTDIDREKASAALGIVGNAPVLELLKCIADKNTAEALIKLEEIYNASKDMSVLCSELAEMFRNLLVVKYASDKVSKILDADPDVIVTLRDCETRFTKERLLYSLDVCEQTQNKLAKSGLSRKTLTELMIIKLADPKMSTSAEALLERISDIEAKLNSGAVFSSSAHAAVSHTPSAEKTATVTKEDIPDISDYDIPPLPQEQTEYIKEEVTEKIEPKAEPESVSEPDGDTVEMLSFGELLDILKTQNVIIYSMLSDSYADICKGDILKIYVNPMGYFMLSNDKEKTATVEAAASKLLGMNVRVVFVQTNNLKKRDSKPNLEDF
jgi:DNA polymerase-3 subunit gamma/tau